MEALSKEQLKVKSLLYPWILVHLLKDQSSILGESLCLPLSLPKSGFYSLCKTAKMGLSWNAAEDTVSFVSQEALRRESIGFAFKSEYSSLRFYEDGVLQPLAIRKGAAAFEWFRFIGSVLKVQNELAVKGWERASEDQLLRKVLLTFYAAVVGLNGLGKIDPFSRQLLEHLPDGQIRIHIEGVGENLAFLNFQKGDITWHTLPPAIPLNRSVDFTFSSLELAWKSVANLADNLSAVGKGEIRLRGYIPLADGFNHMLDRLQIFVKTA